MKTHGNTIIVLAVVCLGLFLTAHLAAQNAGEGTTPEADGRWEHMAMTHHVGPNATDAELARKITQINQQGWEMVDVESVDSDGTTEKMIYFFKRPQ